MTNSIRDGVWRIGSLPSAANLKPRISAAAVPVFDFVAAEGVLPKVLTGYGCLPPSSEHPETQDCGTSPDRPGQCISRTTAQPANKSPPMSDRPVYFAYHTSDYTFALRYLANSAEGQWWLENDGSGTQVRWTHTFHAKNWLALIPLAMQATC